MKKSIVKKTDWKKLALDEQEKNRVLEYRYQIASQSFENLAHGVADVGGNQRTLLEQKRSAERLLNENLVTGKHLQATLVDAIKEIASLRRKLARAKRK